MRVDRLEVELKLLMHSLRHESLLLIHTSESDAFISLSNDRVPPRVPTRKYKGLEVIHSISPSFCMRTLSQGSGRLRQRTIHSSPQLCDDSARVSRQEDGTARNDHICACGKNSE